MRTQAALVAAAGSCLAAPALLPAATNAWSLHWSGLTQVSSSDCRFEAETVIDSYQTILDQCGLNCAADSACKYFSWLYEQDPSGDLGTCTLLSAVAGDPTKYGESESQCGFVINRVDPEPIDPNAT